MLKQHLEMAVDWLIDRFLDRLFQRLDEWFGAFLEGYTSAVAPLLSPPEKSSLWDIFGL